LLQRTDNVRYRGVFLAHGHINTVYRLACFIKLFLVDDRIDTDGGLTGLTVADHQLTLTAADRNHRINGFDTGLQRLGYRLTENYPRSLPLNGHFIGFPGQRT